MDRLVIEAGASSFRLDLDPRMTVIAGAGRLERDGLIGELLTAIGPGRDGVHLELTSDRGARYALFRPAGGRHRMVDVEAAVDVTHRFTDADGRLDPLGRAGISPRDARRLLRLGISDLATTSQHEEMLVALAHVDQGRLWDVARKVDDREAALERLLEATGGSLDDAAVIDEIERRHQRYEEAEAEHERTRSATFVLGAGAGLLVLPAAAMAGALAALPLAAAALAATGISVRAWRRLEAARAEEAEALAAAGAESYIDFTVARVSGLVMNDHQRRAIVQAREAFRAATVEWQLLAGDVPLSWALEHRDEVRRTAEQLRRAAGVGAMSSHLSAEQGTTGTLAPMIQARLDALRHAGPGGESLPLLLDDPLLGVDPAAKSTLLELLMRASAHQQIVYLTTDDDVAGWAELEAMTGGVTIVAPRRSESGDADGARSIVA